MSSIMRRRNGLLASSVMGMLLSDVRLATPHLQTGRSRPDTGPAACRSALPRERFSPLARSVSSLRCGIWSAIGVYPLSGYSGVWQADRPADLWVHALIHFAQYQSLHFGEAAIALC